jgi:DNA primase
MFDFEEYIKDNFEYKKQQSNPEQISISCINPDCSDNDRQKMKMTVNVKNEKAFCYLCGSVYHNAVAFVAEAEGIPMLTAVRLVKNDKAKVVHEENRLEKAMTRLKEKDLPAEEIEKPELELPACVKIEESSLAYKYLFEREFDHSIIENFKLSFIPKGSEPWVYQNRIMIPIYDSEGILVSFQARTIIDGIKPKYIFPVNGAHQNMLYNWYDAKTFGTLILVEGVTDCWRMWLRGYHNVAATFGKTLKAEQVKMIIGNKRTKNVMIFWDGEGLENAWEATGRLTDYKDVYVAELPSGMEPDTCEDPSEYFRKAVHANDLSPLERKIRCL